MSLVMGVLVALVALASLAFTAAPALAAAPTTIGTSGEYAGQVQHPRGVAVNQASGDVYIADEEGQRVEEFEADGAFVRAWGYGVADGGDAFQECTTTCFAGIGGGGPGQFNIPLNIVVDQSSGDVYVTGQEYRVQEFSASGEFLSAFGGQVNKTEVAAREAEEANGETVTVTPAQEDLCTKADLEAHEECGEAVPGTGQGELSNYKPALAIDSAGNVWVGDVERLEEFTPGGVYASEIKLAPGSEAIHALAIDPAGDFYAIREEVVTETNIPGVEKLEGPTGTVPGGVIETLDAAGFANALGVDPATGDLFVSDQPEPSSGATQATLLQYGPTGTHLASFATGQVVGAPEGDALAVGDSAKALYVVGGTAVQSFTVPLPGPYVLPGSLAASPVGATTATLHGTLNPEGAETAYGFEYVSEQQFKEAVPGHGFEHATKVGAGSLAVGAEPFTERAIPVEGEPPVELSHLQPETTYHFRLHATNANGEGNTSEEEATFTTLPSATISEQFATQITADAAILDANIDPLGEATEYHFEYLTEHAYEENIQAGNAGFAGAVLVPSPDAAIGEGEADQHVAQHLQGLEPATAYRYRVVAHNSNGPSVGATQAFTTEAAGSGFALVDGRQWELVSPPDKHGALLAPISGTGVVQAAANGGAVTYLAHSPTESDPRSNANNVQILSTRGPQGWGSQDITGPHETATGNSISYGEEYRFFSSDLSLAFVQPQGTLTPCHSATGVEQPCLSSEATEATAFVRNDTTGVFTPLVSGCPSPGEPCAVDVKEHADVLPGTKFGQQYAISDAENASLGVCTVTVAYYCGPEFIDATPDGNHVMLYSRVPLTKTEPAASSGGLYEWPPAGGSLTLVSVLSEGRGPANEPKLASESPRRVSPGEQPGPSPSAISENGSRVIWEAEGALYLRDVATSETLQVDASEAGCNVCSSGGDGILQFANAAGSRVFFTDDQRLTEDSGASEQGGLTDEPRPDLYECEVIVEPGASHCNLRDLTPLSSGEHANVLGSVLGASADGSWVYFVADGVLDGASNPGAVHGTCANENYSAIQTCNLYAWHEGVTSLVTVLSGEDNPDWSRTFNKHPARVAPDGEWLAFMSQRPLTGYDNRDAASGQPDEEVYLYHASTGALVCASCDPTGARPKGKEYRYIQASANHPGLAGGFVVWPETTWIAANVPGWTPYAHDFAVYQSHYLSNEGRLFFNSSDALVPQDVNGTGDVYEYEPEGVGSEAARCGPGTGDGAEVFKGAHRFVGPDGGGEEAAGCVGLISSGTSAEESAFLDASENGGDVFFLTAARLAPQDLDNDRDVYDAHECTQASPCIAPPVAAPSACTTEASCKASPSPQPSIFGLPASATFSGAGNLTPTVAAPVTKAKAKPLTRAQKLAAALKRCKTKKNRKQRASCEASARKKYAAKLKIKSKSKSRKGGK